MRPWLALGLTTLATTVAAAEPADPVARCRSLLGVQVGPGVVLGATEIFAPDGETGARQSNETGRSHCRVEGRIEAEPGSEIGFEVWLPSGGTWNGRFLAVGSGSSWGRINERQLVPGVSRGFAAAATDEGHKQQRSSDNTWAYRRPERVRDFGGRAQRLTTLAAKAVVERYYGEPPRYSYFWGASRGGGTGLMMAQRHPEDFDGILAGAPAYSWPGSMVRHAWIVKALTATPESALDAHAFDQLNAAVLESCAGPDGLIADPRECAFDPGSLRCPAADGGFCLSDAQVTAVRDIYQGPHDSSGRALSRGLTRGGEFAWKRLWNVPAVGADAAGGSWLGVWRYLVHDDPTWTLDRIDFDVDPLLAERKLGPLLTQDDPDLTAFARRGGRLLLYHGWADDMSSAELSVDYRAAVAAKMGEPAADEVLRLFMIPGVAHSLSDGPGPGGVLHGAEAPAVPLEPGRDLLETLQHWVEDGVAPDQFVASRFDKQGRVTRTRLLCPEPRIARYDGSGDPLDAGSWRCERR